MSRANADWAEEAVASKLLQKYFIAILKTPTTYRRSPPTAHCPSHYEIVKTCSNAFCRLAAADFFMIAVYPSACLSICLSVFPPLRLAAAPCSSSFVLRPSSLKAEKKPKQNAYHMRARQQCCCGSLWYFVRLSVSCVYDCHACGYWGFAAHSSI